jgi:hypothetical protein
LPAEKAKTFVFVCTLHNQRRAGKPKAKPLFKREKPHIIIKSGCLSEQNRQIAARAGSNPLVLKTPQNKTVTDSRHIFMFKPLEIQYLTPSQNDPITA